MTAVSGAHPFTVLYNRSNVLQVLKVLRVHRTKLNDSITDSEPLWREKTVTITGTKQLHFK